MPVIPRSTLTIEVKSADDILRARNVSRHASGYGQSPYQDVEYQRVLPKRNLNYKGWNSQARSEFPGMSESTNLYPRMEILVYSISYYIISYYYITLL